MYILLKDTDKLKDKGFYIKSAVYDREVEKILIELYYRDVAEGLVEYSEKVKSDETLKVVDMVDWVKGKGEGLRSAREVKLLGDLGSKVIR